jgi:hypothetical protein
LDASAIEHAAFATTDNAEFMSEVMPNLILLQDDPSTSPCITQSLTPLIKADPRDYATCVATVAATTFNIADHASRFGRPPHSRGGEKDRCRVKGGSAVAGGGSM